MAAEDTLLTWNVANWITVLLMVTLGFALLGMGNRIWQQKQAQKSA